LEKDPLIILTLTVPSKHWALEIMEVVGVEEIGLVEGIEVDETVGDDVETIGIYVLLIGTDCAMSIDTKTAKTNSFFIFLVQFDLINKRYLNVCD